MLTHLFNTKVSRLLGVLSGHSTITPPNPSFATLAGTTNQLRWMIPFAATPVRWPLTFNGWASQTMRLSVVLVSTCISLAGCCAFAPCHPATSLVGAVQDVEGRPIAYASVTIYGTTSSTDAKGCFNVHIAHALPFTFSVAAKGYKASEVEAKAGFYRVIAKLAPTQSLDQSHIEWVAMSPTEYSSFSPCVH